MYTRQFIEIPLSTPSHINAGARVFPCRPPGLIGASYRRFFLPAARHHGKADIETLTIPWFIRLEQLGDQTTRARDPHNRRRHRFSS